MIRFERKFPIRRSLYSGDLNFVRAHILVNEATKELAAKQNLGLSDLLMLYVCKELRSRELDVDAIIDCFGDKPGMRLSS